MRKLLLTMGLVAGIFSAGLSQSLTMYKTFGGVRFQRDTLIVSIRQVSDILSVNPQAFADFKAARTNYSAAGVLGFAGGFLMAFPVGTLIAGGDPEWGLAAGGAVLIIASIPLSKAFHRRAQSALDQYNAGLTSSRKVKTRLYLMGTGAALQIKF